jgi:hypothetical protein
MLAKIITFNLSDPTTVHGKKTDLEKIEASCNYFEWAFFTIVGHALLHCFLLQIEPVRHRS